MTPWGREGRRLDRSLRHPQENRLLWICVAVTTLTVIGTFDRAITEHSTQPLLVLLVPALVFFTRGQLYARQRVNGVRITEHQFPEIHQIVLDAARAFGLPHPPDAYLVAGHGQINAFASGHGFRRYVAITSDLFEIGVRNGDLAALRFVIGHEVGHIAAGHASFWRQFGISIANLIPGLGSSLSRAQEYTADNHAYRFCPEGVHGLCVLAAGKYLYPRVDFAAIADRARTDQGFFVMLVNLLATHPINTWRFAALRDRSKPGRVF
ncbi:M48 family metallopeptidase [Thermobifida fusca]|jgi:Zn-dependent protease with chaperone function|uniref:Peptidase M48 domain-containing protein n=2 Tax=Thermobifida fusca TaxID=2021 RepID=Q47M53_THEFY|nr:MULTISPECIES: M48 family metallopeptidase [Thermobifida]AAZ56469.1 conserved hypothetical protein [Thermobifida fusca YX]AAF25686.1 putative peptidase A [Thermobifida fusca]MBO2530427.1 peptidase M48 family protein [Thermobifida sp.]PPS91878.1 peptidase M48 family protein [Thermobifida fusca]PZN61367.1 MAG: peptidase M48 family protein [Thermobifida fusca]